MTGRCDVAENEFGINVLYNNRFLMQSDIEHKMFFKFMEENILTLLHELKKHFEIKNLFSQLVKRHLTASFVLVASIVSDLVTMHRKVDYAKVRIVV